jgi:predicted P-loop ATPase/GTPase
MSDTQSKILVVGLQTHDAGKTTLCKALIHGFRQSGVNLVPFKPHSGISYWTQFDAFQESLVRGILLSSDIIELEQAAHSGLPLEILNPVNRLSSPLLDRGLPEERLAFREFVAQRFTRYDGTKPAHVYYLNGTMNLTNVRDMRQFYVAIREKAQKVVFIRSLQQLVKAYLDNFDKATSSCHRFLEDKPLILESFNDAAYPCNGAENCGLVLGVYSNVILQFKADEYFKAIELRGHQKPKLQLTTADVYASSLIKRKYQVQPLSNQERTEPARLIDDYSEIIDDLMRY